MSYTYDGGVWLQSSSSQIKFIKWVKNRYDTGVHFKGALGEGIYESFEDIIERGAYKYRCKIELNTILDNLLPTYEEYLKSIK